MTPQELKNSILQLAIQGKLVEQRPEEGTAEELCKQIQAEKQKLIKADKIKRENLLPEITEDEKPFDIPDSWKWYRIGSVCNIVNGFTPLRSNPEFWDGDISWFTIDDMREQGRFISYTRQHISKAALSNNTMRIVPANTVLLCCTASVGEYAYTNISLTTNQQFNALVVRNEYNHIIDPMFIFEFVQTLKSSLISTAGKTTFNFLSVGKLAEMLIPLPPLAEQKRIVAKIEEMLPYIDRYEQAWSKLEDFNKRFPSDMQKSILQMAIQGKLVEQRPEEGTGEELYKQIQAEKQKLIKAGTIKNEKPLPEITEDEKLFEIPDSWKWVHFKELAVFLNGDRGKNYPNKNEYVDSGIAWINTGHITRNGYLDTQTMNYITEEKFQSLRNGKIEKGDLVYCLRGATFGKVARIEPFSKGAVASSLMIIRLCDLAIREYIYTYLKAPVAGQQLRLYDNGSAQPNLAAKDVEKYVIPLPPLAEQKRIVAKLEEILPLCEKLK